MYRYFCGKLFPEGLFGDAMNIADYLKHGTMYACFECDDRNYPVAYL